MGKRAAHEFGAGASPVAELGEYNWQAHSILVYFIF